MTSDLGAGGESLAVVVTAARDYRWGFLVGLIRLILVRIWFNCRNTTQAGLVKGREFQLW